MFLSVAWCLSNTNLIHPLSFQWKRVFSVVLYLLWLNFLWGCRRCCASDHTVQVSESPVHSRQLLGLPNKSEPPWRQGLWRCVCPHCPAFDFCDPPDFCFGPKRCFLALWNGCDPAKTAKGVYFKESAQQQRLYLKRQKWNLPSVFCEDACPDVTQLWPMECNTFVHAGKMCMVQILYSRERMNGFWYKAVWGNQSV